MRYIGKIYSCLLLIMITVCGCDWQQQPVVIHYGETNVNVTIQVTITFNIEENSEPVLANTDAPSVSFHGFVKDYHTQKAIGNARIRIVGTDTPGGSAVTQPNGTWLVTLPIIPNRNDENSTLFVVEVQKSGAQTASLYDFCKEPSVWKLLGVNNAQEYFVAGVHYESLNWETLKNRIECPITIVMSEWL